MQTAEKSIDRLSFEKVLYFPEHVRQLVAGETAYPVHMQIGPVNYCNHDCTFCFAARTMFDAKGTERTRINVERLLEIVEEMHGLGLRAITMVGAGEPTLHPRITDVIEGLGKLGVGVGLYTNGSCITDECAAALARYATFIRFSMTGASPEVHSLVHGTQDFARVVENISKIVRLRQGRFPTLGSQFVLASYSAGDLIEGAKLAKSLGMDYFEVKPAYVTPDKPDQLANTLTVEEARALCAQLEQYADDNFAICNKWEQMEKVLANQDDREYDDCPGHMSSAVLEADLELYICVNQKIPEFSFGNLTHQSFKDVWHGLRRREILERLNVHECIPRCRQDPLNRIVHEIRMGERTIPVNLPEPDPDLHVDFV